MYRTATHCNTLQQELNPPNVQSAYTCAATHSNTQQHTATHCNTLPQELNPLNVQSAYKKSGAVKKVFDKSVKGYVLELEGGRDVKMQFPAGDKEVTWRIHMWDMTHSYVGGMAHSYV